MKFASGRPRQSPTGFLDTPNPCFAKDIFILCLASYSTDHGEKGQGWSNFSLSSRSLTNVIKTRKGNESKKLEKQSAFVQQTSSLYLPLSPCAYNFPLEGLCAEHISPLLLTYYPPLKGVVLSYSNARMSEHPNEAIDSNTKTGGQKILSRSIDEYAVTYVWLTADFLIFRPKRGTYLEGYVNVQNESILGLICYNYFNAGIERAKLPSDWSWQDENYVDGNGGVVEGKIVFRVDDFEVDGVESIQISGSLVEDG